MAKSVDPDQTAPKRSSLIWVCTLCICNFVGHLGARNFTTFTTPFLRQYPKYMYWEMLYPYSTCPENEQVHFLTCWCHYKVAVLWSGSTLFAQACSSQYLCLLQYLELWVKLEKPSNKSSKSNKNQT